MAQRILALILAIFLAAPAALAVDEKRIAQIYTGGASGVYFPLGGALCRLVNQDRAEHGLRCSARPSAGAGENLAALRTGAAAFGIVQSDRLQDTPNLRAVFEAHSEAFTVVLAEDARIRRFTDLAGKSADVGVEGGGHRDSMQTVMEAYGMAPGSVAQTASVSGGQLADALCEGRIAAAIFMIGHPSAAIKEIAAICEIEFLEMDDRAARRLAESPGYRWAEIPGGVYQNVRRSVDTIGVGAVLVAHKDAPEEDVYLIAKAALQNVAALRKMHPAFKGLDAKTMIRVESAPGLEMHPGAVRAYRELGLIE